MNENLMQKMFKIFESIIKSEGATALTNERIEKLCEENGVGYEEFSALVFEKVMSVIELHSGDALPSELSLKDLEEVAGGAEFFRRGTASALAALSLSGATQLPAFAAKKTDQQVVPEKVASRRLKERSEGDGVVKSKNAQSTAKYLLSAGMGSFLAYLIMSNRSSGAVAPTNYNCGANGFLPEENSPIGEFSRGINKLTPTSGRKGFRVGVLNNTLDYCRKELGFTIEEGNVEKDDNTAIERAYENVWWKLPEVDEKQPKVIDHSFRIGYHKVETPIDVRKFAKIYLSNGRSLQTMVALKNSLGEGFNTQKTALLDFANYFEPGGGALEGCCAQEESICRITTLYPLLRNKYLEDDFYRYSMAKEQVSLNYWKKIGLFRKCVYVPGVKQIKNDYGAGRINGFVDGPTFNVIAAAAPDLRMSRSVGKNSGEYRECFLNLWRLIISTAYEKGNENLVAGALGCGAFENDPKVVAETFFEVLMNEGPNENTRWVESFKNIVLPIYIHNSSPKDIENYYYFSKWLEDYKERYERENHMNLNLDIGTLSLNCPE